MEKITEIAKNSMDKNFINSLKSDFSSELSQVNELILNSLECGEKLILETGRHIINSGGKRIRPLLTIISAKFFGYDGANHLNLAAATELIHAATLLHDDVVDSSIIRRFNPTVNSLWGNKTAILVGDFLFSESFKLMVSSGSMEALRVLSNASSVIARGEVAQLSMSFSNITKKEYYKIIEAKTAELFAASAKVGAIISCVEETDAENIYNYGKNLGLIFQIKDDMLDYFSDINIIGKNIGDDFFEGKITIPIILLLDLLDDTEKELVIENFKSENKNNEDFRIVIDLMKKYKIEEKISVELKLLTENAKNHLNNIKIDNPIYKTYLENLINFASNRES